MKEETKKETLEAIGLKGLKLGSGGRLWARRSVVPQEVTAAARVAFALLNALINPRRGVELGP